jgi:hypothetical protein
MCVKKRPNKIINNKFVNRGEGVGCYKVEFYKVDKRFWHANLSRNWKLHFRLMHFDYIVYVDIYNFSYVGPYKLNFLCPL